ncbi:b356e61b-6ba9-4cef-b1be-b891e322890a [Sclerotinia trifoliorum]|uniref:B356e61b-6ba9-4cef-b1be-b891e322890a n=1 Tax=Sclerotinia trifoliorum TaxID=28548 RepID=A0A8H2ZRI4_9HELO|nr:b356e61b-6ba9-4cef-b1be-b891e322890a [Sclerotinia trifoliorum]
MCIPIPLEIDPSLKPTIGLRRMPPSIDSLCTAVQIRNKAKLLHKIAVINEVSSALNEESCLHMIASGIRYYISFPFRCTSPEAHNHQLQDGKLDLQLYTAIYYTVQLHLERLDVTEVAWLIQNYSIFLLCGTNSCIIAIYLIAENMDSNVQRQPCHKFNSNKICYHLPVCIRGQRFHNRLIQVHFPAMHSNSWFNSWITIIIGHGGNEFEEFAEFLHPTTENVPDRL